MARLLFLLLIVGGVVVFTLQNLSPIGLVFLGIRIQALPLAVWVVGALVAGGFTTLLLSGFFSLSKASVRRSAQRVASEKPRSPWSDSASPAGSASARTARTQNASDFRPAGSGNRRPVDDWEANRTDDWDDWSDGSSNSSNTAARPRSSAASAAARTPINEPVDRPRSDANRSEGRRSEPTRRTDFEASQSPPAGQQSGSSYSYRYRDAQEGGTVRKSNEVYDAEYRVLIPPYTPDAAESVPPPPPPAASTADDDEDWGLDDDLQNRPR